MNRSRTRLLTLLASSAVAALGGWLLWREYAGPRTGSVKLAVLPRVDEPGLPRRPPETAGFEVRLDPRDPREWRFFLNASQAARFFKVTGDPNQVFDPWTYVRDVGNLRLEMPWAEHPDGRFVWVSNSQGCREDHELAAPPAARRVLVAGDSHTCGVCNNRESFANRLEAELARDEPQRGIEVLNAALGGHSFLNYLGTFLRFSAFAPQVFVVGVFGGNDFHEVLPLHLRFGGVPWRQLTAAESARRDAALAEAPDAMGQGFATLDAFRTWPESQALALQGALELCAEIQRTTRVRGARLIVAYLPSPFELSDYADDERVARAKAVLALGAADVHRLAELSDAFLGGLAALDIEAVDLRPVFAAEREPPFWKSDYHLNLRGHALVADALAPAVRSALAD